MKIRARLIPLGQGMLSREALDRVRLQRLQPANAVSGGLFTNQLTKHGMVC